MKESVAGKARNIRANAPSMWAKALAARTVRRSVRGKLMLMMLSTTAAALLVAGIGMLVHDLAVYRQSWASGLATEAQILALSVAPTLAFDDREGAERNLSALRARPAVRAAALYTPQGRLYAQFVRDGEPAPPLLIVHEVDSTSLSGELVELTRKVEYGGEWLGTVYLRAHYDVLARVTAYGGIFLIVVLLSFVAASILSAALQRVITVPIEEVASVARKIVDQRDYSLRARKRTEDEIGIVVDAFNNMLDEVQARTRALEDSNASLQKSERLYRAIGESIAYGVWVADATGRCIYVSESFLQLLGRTQEHCSTKGWSDKLHPDDVESTLAAWRECVREGAYWYREQRVLGADGRYHSVLVQGVPIRDDRGRISGWAGINLDISRLKRTEAALREADRRKDEFLATLAHELRNPLAPIRHATSILDAAAATDEQRQWAREVIARQVRNMSLLLDDLLDVSRITRGRLELRPAPIALDALIAAAVETVRPLLDEKRHDLRVSLPSEPVQLHVDSLRISQAVSNLLTNAAKYTDPGGSISIDASLSEAGVAIAVCDSGIGLSAVALPKLFEMFSQIHGETARSQGGLGIGLALVKGLVTLHGGSVEAASAGPGRGSTFTIRLPREVIVQRTPANAAPVARRGSRAVPCSVLVADDNRDAAESLALLLRVSGYDVHLAHSGGSALETALRERPDVLILDIGMPDLSGYDVAQQIRREPWSRESLFLAVTGWGQREDKARAQAAGFDLHFTKPVAMHELEAHIAEHFAARLTG